MPSSALPYVAEANSQVTLTISAGSCFDFNIFYRAVLTFWTAAKTQRSAERHFADSGVSVALYQIRMSGQVELEPYESPATAHSLRYGLESRFAACACPISFCAAASHFSSVPRNRMAIVPSRIVSVRLPA